MSWNPLARTDLPLEGLELELYHRKKKILLIVAISLVVLLGLGWLSARPAINLVRGWQARRHAAKAFAAINAGQWGTAQKEAVDGYQLRPNEPQAIRAVALLCTRAGQADGLKFWKELGDRTTLTRSDLRDEATLAIRGRELPVAEEAIKQLLAKDRGGPTPGDWLLAGELALQAQDPDRALMYTREVFGRTGISDQDQFQAVLNLDGAFREKDAGDRKEVFSRLSTLARGTGPVSLEALVALAQRMQNPSAGASATDAMSFDDVIHGLETHPDAKLQHKLLALDLKIREHPEETKKVITGAIQQYENSDQTALIALAAWLNSHGQYERELETIPRERAVQTRELFFQYVDALGGLGRWDEIRRLIESEQFSLDPVIEYMYLARCFAQQNQASGAENNWKRALQAAAGDLSKLMTLGDYAEKNGAFDVAASAYDAAVAVSPKARPAQQGRLRVAYSQRDTHRILAILKDLLKLWPNDTAVQNDEAYAQLLLLPNEAASPPDKVTEELLSIEALAAKLVEKEPSSLPHRTLLALARLRLNRPEDAFAVYKGINVPKTSLTTSSVAVHATVLAATGHEDEGRAEFAQLPKEKLLPEEQRLLPPQ
jgi:tetratricopeptide (TPR) repeat protein